MPQDRPTAAELLEAVREFLEKDIFPEVDKRRSFHTRVAMNVLGIVQRELELGPAVEAKERERLGKLLGRDGTAAELTAELARRIRDGSLESRREEVLALVRESVRDKLSIANPKYFQDES